jgi:hypothetical protein
MNAFDPRSRLPPEGHAAGLPALNGKRRCRLALGSKRIEAAGLDRVQTFKT